MRKKAAQRRIGLCKAYSLPSSYSRVMQRPARCQLLHAYCQSYSVRRLTHLQRCMSLLVVHRNICFGPLLVSNSFEIGIMHSSVMLHVRHTCHGHAASHFHLHSSSCPCLMHCPCCSIGQVTHLAVCPSLLVMYLQACVRVIRMSACVLCWSVRLLRLVSCKAACCCIIATPVMAAQRITSTCTAACACVSCIVNAA